MEMQIIHEGDNKENLNKKVILSFLFERKAGAYNQFIEDLDFFNLPDYRNTSTDITRKLYIPKIFYSIGDENLTIMKPFSFYRYDGSLTFPPCEENVTFYVAAKTIEISSSALDMFKEAIKTHKAFDYEDEKVKSNDNDNEYDNLKGNNRILQDLNNREIFYYDYEENLGPDPMKKIKTKSYDNPRGHWEKIVKKGFDYVYINSMEPTGLPEAFVVHESEFKQNEKIEKINKLDIC
jgi:carbonic anhydrase